MCVISGRRDGDSSRGEGGEDRDRARERHWWKLSRFHVDDMPACQTEGVRMPQMQSPERSHCETVVTCFRTHLSPVRLDSVIAGLVAKEFGNHTFKVECGGLRPGSNTVDLAFRSPESGGHVMKCTRGFCWRHGIPCRHALAVANCESPFLHPNVLQRGFFWANLPTFTHVPRVYTYVVAAADACVAQPSPKMLLSLPFRRVP